MSVVEPTDGAGSVHYRVGDGVAHVELSRPEASNAVDLATAHALRAAMEAAAADDAVRAVLVCGEGARFCAGGDVRSMLAAHDRASYLEQLAGALDEALLVLHRLDKPIIAAVQGAVAGAGLAVMLSCDLVVAESSTRFVSAYAAVGLTPDCGLSWLLPRAVGQQRALELLLTSRTLTADEAQTWGLITVVTADGEARERATELARRLAAGPALALGQTRRLARASWELDRSHIGVEEAAVIARAVQTPDATVLLEGFVGH